MAEHREAARKATATLADMMATTTAIQAAILREAPAHEIEALRGKAHDLLDAYMDRQGEAAQATLDILKG